MAFDANHAMIEAAAQRRAINHSATEGLCVVIVNAGRHLFSLHVFVFMVDAHDHPRITLPLQSPSTH